MTYRARSATVIGATRSRGLGRMVELEGMMGRVILRDWISNTPITVALPDSPSAQGIYAGHEIEPPDAYQIRQKHTGRIYVSDGDVEYVGFPVVEQK